MAFGHQFSLMTCHISWYDDGVQAPLCVKVESVIATHLPLPAITLSHLSIYRH